MSYKFRGVIILEGQNLGAKVSHPEFWSNKIFLCQNQHLGIQFGSDNLGTTFLPTFQNPQKKTSRNLSFSQIQKGAKPQLPKEACLYHLKKFSKNSGRTPTLYLNQICKNIPYLAREILVIFPTLTSAPNLVIF